MLPNALFKCVVISHFMIPEALHFAEHDPSFLESKTSFGAAKLIGKFSGHSRSATTAYLDGHPPTNPSLEAVVTGT
jgi:prepilin-type processing-associated H-X9-DG protein